MKKVLFFIESLSGGGAEKVLSDLVSNLDKTKYEVTVATITNGGVYEKTVSAECNYYSFLDTKTYGKGIFKKLLYFFRYRWIYKSPAEKVYKKYIRDKYDIEIAFVEGFSTKLIANSLNNDSKKIAWVHIDVNNNPYADNYYSSLKEHIEAYEKFDKILCVSQSVKDSVINKFNPKTPVEIQYNPVDSNTVVRLSEESIPISVNDDIQLVTIGRLENQKGYIRLIEQLNKLKCEGYAFSLWIIGEGSQRPVLESMIKDYNLDNNVKLLGFQTNPYKYVSKSDAFICSSYAEGFSTAATESLILGRPIITVDCAGMKELFSDKNCGIICDNTDEALYEMIKTVLDKPKLLDSFKDDVNVRKNDFNISVRIKEIEDIFESFAGV